MEPIIPPIIIIPPSKPAESVLTVRTFIIGSIHVVKAVKTPMPMKNIAESIIMFLFLITLINSENVTISFSFICLGFSFPKK